MNEMFNGLGVEVEPLARDEFLKVRETLTRIGKMIPPTELQQTCFVLHKRGKYSIMHHLEMKKLDGMDVNMTDDDVGHRNTVAHLLEQWGLVTVLDEESIKSPRAPMGGVAVISFADKSRYRLIPNYEIGRTVR